LRYPYLPSDEIKDVTEATNAALGGLRGELSASLGWGGLDGTLRYLYFSSGHGLIFKSFENNPFANPLKQAAPGASGAR